jgi:DNA-binding NarL/FixJ family response regulator
MAGMAGDVRIVLLEDDAPTRERLRDALAAEPGFAVVAVGTVAAAREEIARWPPQVLVTDLELPDGLGVELTAVVRGAHPSVEILVISVLCDERSVVAAIAAGASGYIVKDALPEDIAATVRQVLRGESPLSAAIARYLLRRLQPPGGTGAGAASGAAATPAKGDGGGLGLTRRETDILWGIAKGMTYNEIADGLGISRKTVPNYIKSIYRKLEVNSRGEAVFEAISRKLIRL